MRNLILVPGLNNTAAVWNEVVSELAGKANCWPVTNPVLDSVDAIAEQLLPQLPDRFHLCGFSFGGYVSLAILAIVPERVEGLALVGTTTFADSPQQIEARAKMAAAVRAGDYESLIAEQAAGAFHPESLTRPDVMTRRQQIVAAYGRDRYLAHQAAAIRRPDRTHLVDAFSGPVLLVAAEQDAVCPPAAMKRMLPRIPAAAFETIGPSGHLLPLEQPAALAAVLANWLHANEASCEPLRVRRNSA